MEMDALEFGRRLGRSQRKVKQLEAKVKRLEGEAASSAAVNALQRASPHCVLLNSPPKKPIPRASCLEQHADGVRLLGCGSAAYLSRGAVHGHCCSFLRGEFVGCVGI